MDAYIQRFERYADNEGLDADCYGTYLGSLLSGKALEVYSRLPASEARDYYKLKEALLIHYQLTQEDYRKKFHSGTQTSIFTSARAAVGGSVKPHQPNRDTDPRSNSQPKPNRPNTGPNWNQHLGRGLCYLCQKHGRRAAACPTGRPQRYDDRMRQPVHGHAAFLIEDGDEYSFPVIGGGSVLEKDNLPLMKGLIGDQVVTVLRDTGSTGVMVKADLVHPSQFTGRNQKLMMVNSRLEEFPVAWIQVDTPVFSGYVQALCLPNPIYDLVIGNIPGVHPDILGDSGMNTTKGMYQEKVITSIEASECVVTPINSARTVDFKVNANTCNEGEGSIQVGLSTNEISGKEEAGRELPIGEVNVIGGPVQTRGGRVREMHPLKPLLIRGSPEYQQCSPKQFKGAQVQDPSLEIFFEWAKEPFQGNNSRVKWFEMDGDLLVRRYKRPEDGILLTHVMVHKKLRNEVLRLGHEGILAGHLGIKKSSDRIITNFYWPGIFGDIRRCCQSCDICQRTVNKGSVRKAPVQSVTWVHIPFDKVATDLIGPLYPVTNRGKRYIPTVVDFFRFNLVTQT